MLKWLVLLLFVICDVIVGVSLVKVLLARHYSGAASVEWALSKRRRRRWYALVCVAALAYAALAPVFLIVLIRAMKAW